jgi:hypothetical protein
VRLGRDTIGAFVSHQIAVERSASTQVKVEERHLGPRHYREGRTCRVQWLALTRVSLLYVSEETEAFFKCEPRVAEIRRCQISPGRTLARVRAVIGEVHGVSYRTGVSAPSLSHRRLGRAAVGDWESLRLSSRMASVNRQQTAARAASAPQPQGDSGSVAAEVLPGRSPLCLGGGWGWGTSSSGAKVRPRSWDPLDRAHPDGRWRHGP